MERRVVSNRACVKKSVSEALQLDDGPNPNAAYIKYLECMQTIVSSLLLDATTHNDVTKDTTNFVKLGLQCMERISLIVESLPKASMTGRPCPLSLPPTNILNSFESDPVEQNYSSLPVTQHQSHVPPATPTSLILQSPTERFVGPSTNVPSLMTSPTTNSTVPMYKQVDDSQLSPMELAQRQNKKLLAAYQARIARSGSTKQHQATMVNYTKPIHTELTVKPVLSIHQILLQNLTLQRRMAENLAVAKAREKTITRKLEERHQRLQQDAVRRFNNAADMSKEELERHHLYTEILDYEKSRNNLVKWRQRLEKSPEDDNIILGLVNTILSLPDHPLTQLIYKYQHATYNKLGPLVEKYAHKPPTLSANEKPQDASDAPSTESTQNTADIDKAEEARENGSPLSPVSKTSSPNDSEYEEVSREEITRLEVEALQRHLRNIVADVHSYLEQLLCMFTVAYEPLGTASGKDICYSAIEEPFFKPIWGYLAALFRIVDKADEDIARGVMNKYQDCLPSTLKVPSRYCLEDVAVPTSHAFPYAPAVQELALLGRLTSPLSQLECIVGVSKIICNCVEEYYKNLGTPESTGLFNLDELLVRFICKFLWTTCYLMLTQYHPCEILKIDVQWGADDLLPILSYVIVRSGRPQLVAECHVLEEFIHEGYLIGEEGYCLTSLQTALGYVLTLIDHSPT